MLRQPSKQRGSLWFKEIFATYCPEPEHTEQPEQEPNVEDDTEDAA
jgi:hypothetical protein